jgi:hypothetical protein
VFIEEVKGHIFNKRVHLKKSRMARWWCRSKGWTYRILFEEDLEDVL